MCGIIGIVSEERVVSRVMTGLKALEYRGYDSSGIAVIEDQNINIIKSEGKICNLENKLDKYPIDGKIAIAHTRWATHGKANDINAHPHMEGNVAIVHNGIIENYKVLKQDLINEKSIFKSDTDSEIIAHLIHYYLNLNYNHYEASKMAFQRLEGSYSIAVIFNNQPNLIIATKKSSPLIIGYGKNENFISSDSYSLGMLTNKISYLEDNDIAVITNRSADIYKNDKISKNKIHIINNNKNKTDKGNYAHYMIKEICEQPYIIEQNFLAYIKNDMSLFNKLSELVKNISKINIIACGTSYHAGMVSKYWLEELTDLSVNVDIASEFRYRKFKMNNNELFIFISQSGETADTIAALKYIKSFKQHNLSIVNVKESNMAYSSDDFLEIFAGIEIGVASTKAFTAQLITLALFSVFTAKVRNSINENKIDEIYDDIKNIKSKLQNIIDHDKIIKEIAKEVSDKKYMLYTARGNIYPIALESALKMKELTYIPVEAIASGELKHGTIALIDSESIIVIFALNDNLFEKTLSNINEIAARNGKIIAITNQSVYELLKDIIYKAIIIPEGNFISNPILATIPAQLLAYYTALYIGNDVDQPRNLAKSVTVE